MDTQATTAAGSGLDADTLDGLQLGLVMAKM
jgi:hypothetical protein